MGTLLRFVVQQGTEAALLPFYINYPDDDATEDFERAKYRKLEPSNPFDHANLLNWDIHYEIHCNSPGAYHYYFEKQKDGVPHIFSLHICFNPSMLFLYPQLTCPNSQVVGLLSNRSS
jgi:hypothetical protein